MSDKNRVVVVVSNTRGYCSTVQNGTDDEQDRKVLIQDQLIW